MGDHNRRICNELTEKHKNNNYGLVVIDSLRTSHVLADKDSEVPTIVYGSFARMFPGATVFIIHHDRKTKIPDGKTYQRNIEVDNESFSGSQAWIDRATTSLKILKGYGDLKEWITLSQTKSQVGQEMESIQVKIKDGCQFSQASEMLDSEIEAAIPVVLPVGHHIKSTGQLDKALAGYFQVTVRWAAIRRQQYEDTHSKILSPPPPAQPVKKEGT
jgi:hypothetical protein